MAPGSDQPITVLMVAEKPSLAKSLAEFLSDGRMTTSRESLDVHSWLGNFQGFPAYFKVTSVIGHVLSIDFPSEYSSWEKVDPGTLFEAPIIRNEANPKARVCRHLKTEAKGADVLILALDADREGENICFEVIDSTEQWMTPLHLLPPLFKQQRIFRAKFSAVSAPAIKAAMANLTTPNQNEAFAVDARQELDLKVGVAFTRFQSRYFQNKYGNLDSTLISFGPCQTPTLTFCVERHQAILHFKPEPFWRVHPIVSKSGHRLHLEWSRGKVFDPEVGLCFQKIVAEGKMLHVVDVSEKEERRQRPPGLNTVELLKAASQLLGIGPSHAMSIAERLYSLGYLSYPRTESSAYPLNFDFQEILVAQRRHPVWGEYASALLLLQQQHDNFSTGGGGGNGMDVGDHPPITPVRAATEESLGGGSDWLIYDLVARHFLGSISEDCLVRKGKAVFEAGKEMFTASGVSVVHPGFTAIMHWRTISSEPLPTLIKGESLPMLDVELVAGKTSAPDYLSEAELIGKMEKHGIGTDASIPTHINNICERNFVTIQSGRRVVPTELGITLIRGYQVIDPELCRPAVRAYVEKQIEMIAQGKADMQAVVNHCLLQFKQKFAYFVGNISKMDALFEASFSPLASSGKVLSKCGKCSRYMKLVASRPSRLYCPTCEEVRIDVSFFLSFFYRAYRRDFEFLSFFFLFSPFHQIYAVPQGGSIKLYKELVCPLDNFQLVMYSLGGADGKTTVLCPNCYSNPPFENALLTGDKASGGMPCTTCQHPTCRHSPARNGIGACAACENGTLVLDPVSAPAWRINCNLCDFLMYLPKDLHKVKVGSGGAGGSKKECPGCGLSLLEFDWKKGHTPAAVEESGHSEGGDEVYCACVVCDDVVAALCEVKHGRAYVRRGGRGGRGRGRVRGRGRARVDPLMSFNAF